MPVSIRNAFLLCAILLLKPYPASAAFYNGADLKHLCISLEHGFTMANISRFKCEAYLMGYIDKQLQGNTQAGKELECVQQPEDIARLAKLIIQTLDNNPDLQQQPAATVIATTVSAHPPCP